MRFNRRKADRARASIGDEVTAVVLSRLRPFPWEEKPAASEDQLEPLNLARLRLATTARELGRVDAEQRGGDGGALGPIRSLSPALETAPD